MIEWTADYSVGVEQFDNQHKQLLSCLNTLKDAIDQGKEKSVMTEILKYMTDYTMNHFYDEERLMYRTEYPYYLEHKREHDDLLIAVAKMVKEHPSGLELYEFLLEWLSHHIQKTDRQYGLFFNQKGIY